MNKPTKRSTPSLFELVSVSAEIKNKLIESGGEISEELERDLVRNKEELEVKAIAYAYTIDSIKKDIELLKDMESQIKDRKNALENSIKRISGALLSGLVASEVSKIEGAPYRITVGKKRGYPNYYNEAEIPEEYIERTFTISEEELDILLSSHPVAFELLCLHCMESSTSSSVSQKINKAKVLEDLKSGKKIYGVEFIDTDKQLYIK